MNEDALVAVAKALSDPTRYRMLQEIRARREMTCTEVTECFRLAQPTISHHLTTLRKAGLISVRKEGVFHYLTAVPTVLRDFCTTVNAGQTPAKTQSPARRQGAASPRKPAPRTTTRPPARTPAKKTSRRARAG